MSDVAASREDHCPLCNGVMDYFGEALFCSFHCRECGLRLAIVSEDGPAELRSLLPAEGGYSRSSAIVEEPMAVATEHRLRVKHHKGSDWTEWRQGPANLSPLAREGLDVEERSLSPQPHTGRAGVTEEMLNRASECLENAKVTGENPTSQHALEYRLGELLDALNAALTVEPEAGEVK